MKYTQTCQVEFFRPTSGQGEEGEREGEVGELRKALC